MSEENTAQIETNMSEEEKLLTQRKKEVLLRKEIAVAEQEIAVAEKSKLGAQLPSSETKPVEGKITTDDKFGYIAELTAYDAMVRRADAIAKTIDNLSLKNAHLLIVDSLDFCGADVQLLQVSNQLKFWGDEFHDQDKEIQKLLVEREGLPEREGWFAPAAVVPALALLPGVLGAAADVVGYFRMDYDIKGREFKLADVALQARVADRIQKHSAYLLHFHRITSSPVIDMFNQRIMEQRQLKFSMARLKSQVIDQLATETDTLKEEIQTLEAALKKLKSPQDDAKIAEKNNTLKQKIKQLSQAETKKSQAETAYARSESLIKVFDEFNKTFTSVPAGKDYSPVASAVIRQYLDQIEITHLLYLTVTSSGGDAITSKGWLQSGRVGFLGGGVVTYVLADVTGKIIAADTVTGSSYVKFKLGQDSPPVFKTWEEA